MSNKGAELIAVNAMKAHRAGRFDQAEALCRKALDSNPDNFRSLVHLSVLLRHKGQFDESALVAERAISIEPLSVDGYLQLGLCFLGSGAPDMAANVFEKAISLAPKLAPLRYNLGLALENLGQRGEAKTAFQEALRLDPRDVRARISLGSVLLVEEDIRGAHAQASAAIQIDPKSSSAHLLRAKAFVAEGMGDRAEECIREAVQLDPESSFVHTMLGFRLLQKGCFGEAEAEFSRSIDLDPAQGVAFFGITQARKLTESDRGLIERMEQTVQTTPLTLEQASYLHFGLANGRDNLGEYEKAMSHYELAHSSAYLFRYGEGHFDANPYADEVAAIQNLYTKSLLNERGDHIDSPLPIFIVGMMRSGTTLTEQILSSHPAIGAAGENAFWAKRAHLAENLDWGYVDRKQAAILAREYCRELRKISPGSTRVTDKLPGNYFRLGLIHLAMPNAKIIHCKRDPVDTALSIYFTANPTAPAFSHTKEGIVFAYRRYLELMEHWRSVLPADRFYEIEYEDLVAHPEQVIRGIVEFLGLDWNEACLSHHNNAKEVRTPSLWQVRQPMYKTSVQRWRRYEPWLGALNELKDLGRAP